MNTYDKIPMIKKASSWEMIPIRECGQKLVNVEKLDSDYIVSKPMYYIQSIPNSLKSCYVREEIAELLLQAAKSLPSEFKLVVYDGYRPYQVQLSLYQSYYNQLKVAEPDLKEEELIRKTKTYVSIPSTDSKAPSTHLTGGAVDVTLAYRKNGEEVNLGTAFDDFSSKAKTLYYEELVQKGTDLSSQEKSFLDYRRLLFHTLIDVGFVNYPEEWWHFDYGNQWWASIKNKEEAKFGYIDSSSILP